MTDGSFPRLSDPAELARTTDPLPTEDRRSGKGLSVSLQATEAEAVTGPVDLVHLEDLQA